jgi:hypothetical protein
MPTQALTEAANLGLSLAKGHLEGQRHGTDPSTGPI